VDIGGTKIAGGLVHPHGEIINWKECPTEAGKGKITDNLLSLLHSLLPKEGIEAIGIACAGLIDPYKGVVITSPHLPDWSFFPLKERVEAEWGIRTYLMNDANAAALGEHIYGAGRGVKNLIYVTVSTGIGGGVILNGKLYTGAWGTAGEVGHTTIEANGPLCDCGNKGCWEALASGSAIAKEAIKGVIEGIPTSIGEVVSKGEDISAQVVYEAAQRGDRLASDIIHKAAIYFGIGLANLVNMFNPELIIIGGGVAKMGRVFIEPAVAEMKRRAFTIPAEKVRLTLSQLWERAAILGLVAYLQEVK
jgi:glucokinase